MSTASIRTRLLNRARPLAERARRGSALLITLISVVVLAILSTGAVLGAMQEFRAGRNTLVEQRAFAVAEFGLNQEIARWDRRRNLPPPTGMAIGAIDSTNVFVAQGDTARIRIQRLTDNTFWVVSVGRASIGNTQLEAQRQTHMAVRIAYPSIKPGAAIVTAGTLRLRGNPTVDGRDTDPPGWSQCAQIAGRDTFAIAYAPDHPPNYQGQSESGVINGTNADPAAADSNTYVRYGTESWNSLVANANLRIPSGTYQPQPSGTITTCNYGVNTNWGEPRRPTLIAGCQDYFPIIYAEGTVTINGNGRGQGILLVNGDLRITGTLDWHGLIVVRDDIDAGNGTAKVMGSVMARNAILDNELSALGGTADFFWSSCALESALRGSAILTRTKERSWVQLY